MFVQNNWFDFFFQKLDLHFWILLQYSHLKLLISFILVESTLTRKAGKSCFCWHASTFKFVNHHLYLLPFPSRCQQITSNLRQTFQFWNSRTLSVTSVFQSYLMNSGRTAITIDISQFSNSSASKITGLFFQSKSQMKIWNWTKISDWTISSSKLSVRILIFRKLQ